MTQTGADIVVANPALEGVSVVIPACDEADGVAEVLDDLLATMSALDGIDFEIIVVDDGSRDATADVIQPYVSDRLQLIRHQANQGYGAAIKTGVRAARYPWIVITDADGTYPSRFIPELLSQRDQHSMIVGARSGAIPLIRRPPKWVLRQLASYLARRRIPDLNSGLRVIEKASLERFRRILPDGFSLTTTITLAMMGDGEPVAYHPIEYLRRTGRSKIRPIADTLNFFQIILRTIMIFNPMRVFLPVSLTFLGSSFAVGLGSHFLFGRLMDVTTVLLFVTGVQILALGMVADALNRRIG